MRTKALLGLAVLAVSAATCVAQNVYSLNIVGYVNQPVEANKFYLMENPLTKANSGGNNITNLVPTLDNAFDGSILYTFESGALVVAATYVADFGWYSDVPAQADLPPGKGFYLFPTAAGTVTFVGEVVTQSTQTLAGGNRFNLVGSAFPASMSLIALGLTGQDGDIVYRYSTAANSLNPITYVADYGWYDDSQPNGGPVEGPNLNVGEGIFYFNANTDFSWAQSFTVQ